jgi:MoaA/NifB/PqqE/SkfB family radical SAM enzyme
VCGACEYNVICGGSRSRALALTGNHLASDPWCLYQPASISVSPGRSVMTTA